MSTAQQIKTNTAPQRTSQPNTDQTLLGRIPLGFEYNKTLQEIRREVRQRTV